MSITIKHLLAFSLSILLMACASDDLNTAPSTVDSTEQNTNDDGIIVGHIGLDDNDSDASTETQAVSPGVDISHRYQYEVRGKQYKVFNQVGQFQEIGIASWYGPGFHGKKTASGEKYNMHKMTAAHKTLPLGSRVLVTNLSTGKKVTVRINDRGPFHRGRVIDLSKKAAHKLGIIKKGWAKVHVKAIQ